MLCPSFTLGLFSSLAIHFSAISAQESRAYDEFKTEPNFRPPFINITHQTTDTSLLAPGYYFYEPFALDGVPGAPIIFDSNGQLIWYGLEATIHQAKNFRVCDYLGEKGTHLCWSEFSFTTLNSERSRNRIFDNSYEAVRRDFGAVGDLDDPNPHEFNMLAGGQTFTHAVYQMRRINLEPYGPKGGHIIDPCFQEVDVVTGRQVFRWCGLDHLELWETIMFPHIPGQTNYSEAIAGDTSSTGPWDFAHINGVDKILHGASAGDFLISCRHHDTIYKIAGPDTLSGAKPGTILWRFGGEGAVHKDFAMVSNFTFSRQHHISFLGYDLDGRLKISLFNNGWELRNKAGFEGRASSGQVILLDEAEMEAELLHDYIQPNGGLAIAQGGMHVTAEKNNAVIGWGTVPEISEFAEDGTLLFHARFNDAKARNYRAFKFPWVGRPKTSPKLLAYSQKCGAAAAESSTNETSPLIAYVSWNGATEVASYRFHVSTSSSSGPWIPAGTFARTGFETQANLTGSLFSNFARFAPYVSVEALDSHGVVLGSTQTATWVPKEGNKQYQRLCGEEGCAMEYFKYLPEESCGEACRGSLIPAWVALLVLIVGLECMAWLGIKMLTKASEGGYPVFMIRKGSNVSEEDGFGGTGNVFRPGMKRNKSGWERPGKSDELLKASGHEA